MAGAGGTSRLTLTSTRRATLPHFRDRCAREPRPAGRAHKSAIVPGERHGKDNRSIRPRFRRTDNARDTSIPPAAGPHQTECDLRIGEKSAERRMAGGTTQPPVLTYPVERAGVPRALQQEPPDPPAARPCELRRSAC